MRLYLSGYSMTVHLVTFSDESMSRAAQLCVDSAERNGVNGHSRHNPGNILHNDAMRSYWPAMDRVFNHARGCGYWAWKPLIVKTELEFWEPGDIVIYSDAGVEFINNVSHIIDRMDQDIFLFGNNWEHAHWCKRDVVEAVMSKDLMPAYTHWALPVPWEFFGKQVQASVIFFRVSDYTRAFVKEWLDRCLFEGGRLIDDSPSRLPNHPEFQEHRHDQSILTTMAYRDGLKLHWWGARYNMDLPNGGFVYPKLPEYAADDYEPFVHHHRKRNHDWSEAA